MSRDTDRRNKHKHAVIKREGSICFHIKRLSLEQTNGEAGWWWCIAPFTVALSQIFVFGGYDGNRNHSTLHIFDYTTLRWSCQKVGGRAPPGEPRRWLIVMLAGYRDSIFSHLLSLHVYLPGRNGHTATLADRKLFIIGGWLGSGPLAASDMHYLDLGE